MPTNVRAVKMTIPEAEPLADLYGIAYDLEDAKYLCDKAREFSKPRRHDMKIVDALVAAAIIKYFRCFGKGHRTRLISKENFMHTQENKEAHDLFEAHRNKHIAHPVNLFDEIFVTATVAERNGIKYPIRGIHPGGDRGHFSASDSNKLSQLISNVLDLVNERIATEECQLLSVVQSMDPNIFHRGDLHSPRQLRAGGVYKSRKQSARSGRAQVRRHKRQGTV